jgi:hypothetical protein
MQRVHVVVGARLMHESTRHIQKIACFQPAVEQYRQMSDLLLCEVTCISKPSELNSKAIDRFQKTVNDETILDPPLLSLGSASSSLAGAQTVQCLRPSN